MFFEARFASILMSLPVATLLVGLLLFGGPVAAAGDWPTHRYDIGRTGSSPHGIDSNLHLHWMRELPEPRRAWPWQMDDFEKLAFDKSYEPVVAHGMVYVASMVTDSVTAYSAETGREVWRYHADGPVRLAPTIWEGRVYAAADDGYLHCLDAETGAKLWKFRAGSRERLVLGNERLISIWAARGAPVIVDGMLYFAAGLWPSEGVFIYALDAETGQVQWKNSGAASDMIVDSKRYYSFGGVVPQGQLAVQGDRLLVAGGRTAPAMFDRHTGEQLFYHIGSSTTTKGGGGHRVFVQGDWYFNMRDRFVTHMYAVEDGAQFGAVPVDLTTADAFIGVSPGAERINAFASVLEVDSEEVPEPVYDRRGQLISEGPLDAIGRGGSLADRLRSGALSEHYRLERLWVSEKIDGIERLHAKADTVLFGSGADGRVYAIATPSSADESPNLLWTKQVDSEVFSIVPAHGRLFVTTVSGRIYCFGPSEREAEIFAHSPTLLETQGDAWAAHAAAALAETDPRGGYALMFGVGSGRLLEEILAQSDLHITAYDPHPAKVAALREQFVEAGLYGHRVVVHEGRATDLRLPPYIASLVLSEDPRSAGLNDGAAFVRALYHPLRPYGGMIYLPVDGRTQSTFAAAVEEANLEKFELSRSQDAAQLVRPGALPGSDVWTHQYANAGNAAYSADQRVRAPLGIAWFGGEPNHKTLPRHMHGPIPQVVDGRLIILGPHHISARCVYTGVELWNQEFQKVGDLFTDWDYEAREAPVYFPNHPGANFVGSPYVSSADSIYLIHQDTCLRLDTASGEILDTFHMPDWDDLLQYAPDAVTQDLMQSYGAQLQEADQVKWGNIRYTGDVLLAAAYPHMFDDQQPGRENNWNMTSSEFIVAMDRFTGAIKWIHQARYGFRHNAIAASSDKVFVIDNLSQEILDILNRRGVEPDIDAQVRALDLETGEVLWVHDDEVFGTSLSYSEPHDVLVQSGHPGRRRALPDEPQDRLHAFRGSDGETLWAGFFPHRRSPLGMHAGWGRVIGSTGEMALDMLTGEAMDRPHPITGAIEEWSWVGALRCGTQNYSEHLILFRSGVASFADIAGGGTTGNITGYRPGCTNNLVVADGILNSPEYSRSCSCSYQMQTSVGLVHMPENEMWTYNAFPDPPPGTIRRAGINFGAPASRLDAESQVLWVEYPALVGPTPEIPTEVTVNGGGEWFRHHSAFIEEENGGHRWVAASGIEGESTIRLSSLYAKANPGTLPSYTVRLHFAEPAKSTAEGERVFDVTVQGETVLSEYDIVAETGGALRGIVAEIGGVQPTADGELVVELARANGSSHQPVLSGIEVLLNE